jgi:hypothetical protein
LLAAAARPPPEDRSKAFDLLGARAVGWRDPDGLEIWACRFAADGRDDTAGREATAPRETDGCLAGKAAIPAPDDSRAAIFWRAASRAAGVEIA